MKRFWAYSPYSIAELHEQTIISRDVGKAIQAAVSADISIEAHLRTLEEELLQPDVRKNTSRLDALLAEEFVEFGSSGRVFNKQDIINVLKSESPARLSLTDFKAQLLGPGVVLATYRAVRYGASDEQPVHFLRSSVWRLLDGRWQIVFHQGTALTRNS